jgi:iron complex transport system permease protein
MPRAVPFSVLLTLLAGLVAALFLGSFLIGVYPIQPAHVLAILISKVTKAPSIWPATMETVLLRIRLPRMGAALLAGGALASAGATYQNLFKNPLVSPAILGVSAGAGFGASAALLLSLPWLGVQAMAFTFGLIAVACTLLIARIFQAGSLTVIVLAGLVVSACFEAFISLAKYAADPIDKLPSITFWLMGSLGKAGPTDVLFAAVPISL